MSTYENLIKRLSGYVDTSSKVLQDLLTVFADKIDEIDAEIQDAGELNQTKKRLMQTLREWSLEASPAHSIESLQTALQNRYDYHKHRGSEEGIIADIALLCKSDVDIYKDIPPLNWVADVNYPLFAEGSDVALDFTNACFGFLVNAGIALRFAVNNPRLSNEEIKKIINLNSIPVDIDCYLDIVDDDGYLL